MQNVSQVQKQFQDSRMNYIYTVLQEICIFSATYQVLEGPWTLQRNFRATDAEFIQKSNWYHQYYPSGCTQSIIANSRAHLPLFVATWHRLITSSLDIEQNAILRCTMTVCCRLIMSHWLDWKEKKKLLLKILCNKAHRDKFGDPCLSSCETKHPAEDNLAVWVTQFS